MVDTLDNAEKRRKHFALVKRGLFEVCPNLRSLRNGALVLAIFASAFVRVTEARQFARVLTAKYVTTSTFAGISAREARLNINVAAWK